MNLDKSLLIEFKEKTQFDIQAFLSSVNAFLKSDYNSLVRFYQGSSNDLDKRSYSRFAELNQQLKNVLAVYQLHSKSFQRYEWWEILEVLETIDSTFQSLKNIHRWSRSSISNFGYTGKANISYILSENQTLERISKDVLQDSTPTDDWYRIAMDNELREEDYGPGGKQLALTVTNNQSNLKLDSVVDVVKDKSVHGLDIDRRLTFVDDEENGFDLAILNHQQTTEQAITTLVSLKKNSNPDKPNDGLQSSVIVGGNRALMNFPVIVRQLSQAVATDDSFKNFMVTNISFDQDIFIISYEVYTRLDELIQNTQTL